MAPNSPYVTARAQGVSSIFEGRIFLLRADCFSEGDLIPSRIEEEIIEYRDEKCVVNVANPQMPVSCPVCEKLFVHNVIQHSPFWMRMSFYCTDHLETQWLDLFPKAEGYSTSWDRTNAMPRYVDRARSVAIDDEKLAIGDLVTNPQTGSDRYAGWTKNSPLAYILTPVGLRKVSLPTACKEKAKVFSRTRSWKFLKSLVGR